MTGYNGGFSEVKYPKIIIDGCYIKLKDKALSWDIIKCFIPVIAFIFAFFRESKKPPFIFMLLLVFLSLVFLLEAISLNRVVIDLRSQIVIRTNLSPFVRAWRKFLQIPQEIPFINIQSVYSDEIFGSKASMTRYIIFVRTDDPFNLSIATFINKEECALFLDYLKTQLKSSKKQSLSSNAVSQGSTKVTRE